MKRQWKASPFICGMITAFLISSLVGSSLAVSGRVSFNTASLKINTKTVLYEGEEIQTSSGARIPSIILYTDENGGKSHYIPVRKFAETFDLPISWDGETSCIDMRVGADLGVYLLNTNHKGDTVQFNDELQIIDTIDAQEGTVILPETKHFSENAFETVLDLRPNAGQLVNVTIVNKSDYKPVEVRLGNWSEQNESAATIRFKLLPGETVTHTVRLLTSGSNELLPSPYVFVGNPDEVSRPVNVVVSAIQFDS